MSSSPFTSGNCPTYGKDNSALRTAGYIDATGNLVAAHDAAAAHLGAPWRMPTDAEFSALISNCDTTWTTRGGVFGRLVTGRGAYASKSIFLPAAGYGNGSYLYHVGLFGSYWSSTPNSDYSGYAWDRAFYSREVGRSSYYRYWGLTVRPLREFADATFVMGLARAAAIAVDTTLTDGLVVSGSVNLVYSPIDDGSVSLAINGREVLSSTEPGAYAWTPERPGTYVLDHVAGTNVFTRRIVCAGADDAKELEIGWLDGPVSNLFPNVFASVTNVVIASSVTKLPENAFAGCVGLNQRTSLVIVEGRLLGILDVCPEGVVIPEGVRLIADDAFRNCRSLTSVAIPSSVTSIGESAFAGCEALQTVYVEKGDEERVLAMMEGSGFDAAALDVLNILPDGGPYKETHDGVEWTYFIDSRGAGLRWYYVEKYEHLEEFPCIPFETTGDVAIPTVLGGKAVTWMIDAFYGNQITSIMIPNTVTNIDIDSYAPFEECEKLDAIIVDERNECYKSVDGLLLTKDGSVLISGVNGDVSIPSGVSHIVRRAFFDRLGLTSVTIPSSVTSIGGGAFAWCPGLTNIVFDGNAPTIGSYAFDGVASGCTATVKWGTTGWDDDGDGKWQGLTLKYLGEQLVFDVSSYAGAYDGTGHGIVVNVSASVENAAVTYSLSEDGAYSADPLLFTNVTDGARSVYFRITAYGFLPTNGVATVTIAPKTLTAEMVDAIPAQTYTGAAIKPDVTVTDAPPCVLSADDYTVAYENNVNAGTATAVVTGQGNYAGSVEKTFVIGKASFDVSEVAWEVEEYYLYNGKKQGVTLANVPDGLRVVYDGNEAVDAGEYVATARFECDDPNYIVPASPDDLEWEIGKRGMVILSAGANKPYDGTPLVAHEVSVMGDRFVKGEGADYTFTGSQTEIGESNNDFTYTFWPNTKAANYTITMFESKLKVTQGILRAEVTDGAATYDGTGHGIAVNVTAPAEGATVTYAATEDGAYSEQPVLFTNATETAQAVWFRISAENYAPTSGVAFVTVAPKTLTAEMAGEIPAQTYTGAAIEPTVTVTDARPCIVTTDDYTVAYENNVGAGTASAVVTGRGNYTGTVEKPFAIGKADYDMSGVKWNYAEPFVYDGTEKSVALTGLPTGVKATYSGNAATDAGTHTAQAAFAYDADNYNAPKADDLAWTILPKLATVTAETKASVYGEPDAKLTYAAEGLVAGDALSGELTRDAGSDAGTYAIRLGTVTNANYAITFVGADYTILPHPVSLTSGSASKPFDGTALTCAQVAASGFVEGEGVDCDVTGSQTVVGSSANTFTFAFKPNTKAANYAIMKTEGLLTVTPGVLVFEASDGAATYDGTGHGIAVNVTAPAEGATVTYAATEDGAYSEQPVLFTNATETAQAVWFRISAENYAPTSGVAFVTVAPKTLTAEMVDVIPAQTYTGAAIEPTVTVTDARPCVVTADDYTVAYADNVKPGAATVTVTGGGNYTGTAKATFAIVSAAYDALVTAFEGTGAVDVEDGVWCVTLTNDVVRTVTVPDALGKVQIDLVGHDIAGTPGADGAAGGNAIDIAPVVGVTGPATQLEIVDSLPDAADDIVGGVGGRGADGGCGIAAGDGVAVSVGAGVGIRGGNGGGFAADGGTYGAGGAGVACTVAENLGRIRSVFAVRFDAGAHGALTGGDALQYVAEGEDAVAPDVTPHTDWLFDGWDASFASVTAATTVMAQYRRDTLPLGEALGAPELTWTTEGDALWEGHATAKACDGESAARSGAISHGQTSVLAVTLEGAGTLSFDWRASCETRYDAVRVEVDGKIVRQLSGETAWTNSSVTVGNGSHTVRWIYRKNRSVSAGEDAVWLDNVAWTPAAKPTLAEALNETLEWTTGGSAEWEAYRTDSSYEGGICAVSGLIGNGEWTYVETKVKGVGRLDFVWAVSCDDWCDWCEFYVDDEFAGAITGEEGWTAERYDLGEGEHTLRWVYWKDGQDEADPTGADCAFLDYVRWTPAGGVTDPDLNDEQISEFCLWLKEHRLIDANASVADALSVKTAGVTGKATTMLEEFVVGTDPEDETDVFTAKIEFEDGKPVVTWYPALNGEAVKEGVRTYRIMGAKTLGGGWTEVPEGREADYKFFKVEVSLP